jgi:GntR family transcriptional regulator
MKHSLDESKPIFIQIAESIEDEIINGELNEGEQVPSTNQFASFYQINPATAAKGINLLVDEGILYKKRGIGMFISDGAKELLLQKRKKHFYDEFILAMLQEANKINISKQEVIEMINQNKGGMNK